MYGKFKYNIDKDLYENGEGDELKIYEDKKKFSYIFTIKGEKFEGKAKSFDELDRKLEDFVYSLKSTKEIVETYTAPPKLKDAKKIMEKINGKTNSEATTDN